MKHGIDISYAQGDADIGRLRGKVDFIIIRAGYGGFASQRDEYFERNYSLCKRYKIPCGAYWFAYARNGQEAQQEAKACIEVIKGKRFEYPIYYDVEGQALQGGRDTVSSMCRSFCDALERAGYFAGIYMSADPLENMLDTQVRKRYAIWAAQYGGRLDYSGFAGMWQDSCSGRLPGISGIVDTDICYEDYPGIIKKAHLNGYKKRKRKKGGQEIKKQ